MSYQGFIACYGVAGGGGNWNNDWWAWEHTPGSGRAEQSGDAGDHWHRWPDDLRLLADLGFGSYRFSLEWSRIEPRRVSLQGRAQRTCILPSDRDVDER